MPPKGKKEVDESELPPIERTLCKVRFIGNVNMKDAKKRLSKIKEKGIIPITREKIIEYAESNGLYVNPETWDPKKKMPDGAVTEITETLLIELYKKYFKEQDLAGQRHKQTCIEAEKVGKEHPQDPRWIEDPKKAKKEPPKKKDPKAAEEVEEKELPEETHDKMCDYIYIVFDDFETEEQLLALGDLSDVVLLTVLVKLPVNLQTRELATDESNGS